MKDEKILITPPETENLSSRQIVLPTYHSADICTHILVFPSQSKCTRSYFASIPSLSSSKHPRLESSRLSEGKHSKLFSFELHSFTHCQLNNMMLIFQRVNIVTGTLRQPLKLALDKCTSCKASGRPRKFEMTSFDKMLRAFKEHAQVDFLFITELGNAPILHVCDKATSYSETVQMKSRDMYLVANTFVNLWINSHGPPKLVSADRIFESIFKSILKRNCIMFQERHVRRRSKIGIVETAHISIRLFALRLLKDAE